MELAVFIEFLFSALTFAEKINQSREIASPGKNSSHDGFHSVLTQHLVKIIGSRGSKQTQTIRTHSPESEQMTGTSWNHQVSESDSCYRDYKFHHFSSQAT